MVKKIDSVPCDINMRCENRERTHRSRPETYLAMTPPLQPEERVPNGDPEIEVTGWL